MTNVVSPCTKAEAKALTDRIRKGVDQLWSLLLEAHERKAWKVLGYATWAEYVTTEFQMQARNSYLLLDQGRAIRAIEEAAGANVQSSAQISAAAARDIKDILPSVTDEIKARVEAGEEPDEAVTEVIAESRRVKAEQKAERERQQAENDAARERARAALPENVKRVEAAKARNGSVHAAVAGRSPAARIEELESLNDSLNAKVEEQADYITSLETEIADFKRRLATFDGMAVQWEQGGFEAVIATKDEQIRVLRRQVEDESADKATWARRAEFWKKQAIALGYVSPNEQVEEPEVDQSAMDEAF